MRMSALNDAISDVINGPAKRQELALTLNGKINYILRMEKNMALTSDDALTRKFDADLLKNRADAQRLLGEGISHATAVTRPMWTDMQAKWGDFVPVQDQVRAGAGQQKRRGRRPVDQQIARGGQCDEQQLARLWMWPKRTWTRPTPTPTSFTPTPAPPCC
jgi:hypothetical protein